MRVVAGAQPARGAQATTARGCYQPAWGAAGPQCRLGLGAKQEAPGLRTNANAARLQPSRAARDIVAVVPRTVCPPSQAKGASRSHETLLTKHYCVSNKAHEEAHGFLSQYFPSDGGNRMPRTPRLPSSCQQAFETQRTLGDWRSCPPATSKQE